MINQLRKEEEKIQKIASEVSSENVNLSRKSLNTSQFFTQNYSRSSMSSKYSCCKRTSGRRSKGFEDFQNKIKIYNCSVYASEQYEVLINNTKKRILRDEEHDQNIQKIEIMLRSEITAITSSLTSSNEFDFECKFLY